MSNYIPQPKKRFETKLPEYKNKTTETKNTKNDLELLKKIDSLKKNSEKK